MNRRTSTRFLVIAIALGAVAFLAAPVIALAQGAPPAPVDPNAVLTQVLVDALGKAVEAHGYAALAAVLVTALLHLAQEDVHPTWLAIPAKWRPLLILALTQLGGVLDKVVGGASWKTSLVGGGAATIVALLAQPSLLAMVAGTPLSTPGDGTDQANPSGQAPPAPRTAAKVAMIAGTCLALLLAACTPQVKTIVKSLVDFFGPFACADLQEVTSGTKTAPIAQLCPGAKVVADEMLAKPGATPGACGKHLVVLDAKGARQGIACEELATKVATKLGGSTIAP